MATKKDELTNLALRLEKTMKGKALAPAVKAARTRYQNALAAYWDEVRAAWAAFQKNPSQDLLKVADKYGVDVQDIAEVAR